MRASGTPGYLSVHYDDCPLLDTAYLFFKARMIYITAVDGNRASCHWSVAHFEISEHDHSACPRLLAQKPYYFRRLRSSLELSRPPLRRHSLRL